MYSLTFTGNPGYLKPIEIDSMLDGTRPTTITPINERAYDGTEAIGTDTFADAVAESPTMLGNLNVYGYLDDLTITEMKLLKKCLGDSDGYSDNNIEVYDW